MIEPLWVVIPAAGVGQRMQSDCPKQYLSLAGETILDRTIAVFMANPSIKGVMVGLGEEDGYWPDSKWFNHPSVHTYIGGQERCDTVQKGLQYLSTSTQNTAQLVLVHDAARPLLSQTALNRIIQHHSDHGSLLAMPARDTVKRQKTTSQSVEKTLDRRFIWLAQTPQKFDLNTLLSALLKAQEQSVEITDECSAMEYVGYHPDFLIGESSNIKITLPEDLLIAEALFSYLHQDDLNGDFLVNVDSSKACS